MYITICKIDDRCKFKAGHSKPMLWDNPGGCGEEGGERRGSGWGDTCARMVDTY